MQYIILQFHAQRNFLGVLYIYRLRAESPTAPDIPPPTQEPSNLTQFYPSNLQLTQVFPKFNPDQVCKFCIKLNDSTMAVSTLEQKALRTTFELKNHFRHLLWSLKISLQSKFTYSEVQTFASCYAFDLMNIQLLLTHLNTGKGQ